MILKSCINLIVSYKSMPSKSQVVPSDKRSFLLEAHTSLFRILLPPPQKKPQKKQSFSAFSFGVTDRNSRLDLEW